MPVIVPMYLQEGNLSQVAKPHAKVPYLFVFAVEQPSNLTYLITCVCDMAFKNIIPYIKKIASFYQAQMPKQPYSRQGIDTDQIKKAGYQ